MQKRDHVMSQAATLLLIGAQMRGDAVASDPGPGGSARSARATRPGAPAGVPASDLRRLGFPRLAPGTPRFRPETLQRVAGVRFAETRAAVPSRERPACRRRRRAPGGERVLPGHEPRDRRRAAGGVAPPPAGTRARDRGRVLHSGHHRSRPRAEHPRARRPQPRHAHPQRRRDGAGTARSPQSRRWRRSSSRGAGRLARALRTRPSSSTEPGPARRRGGSRPTAISGPTTAPRSIRPCTAPPTASSGPAVTAMRRGRWPATTCTHGWTATASTASI